MSKAGVWHYCGGVVDEVSDSWEKMEKSVGAVSAVSDTAVLK